VRASQISLRFSGGDYNRYGGFFGPGTGLRTPGNL
jgi:hypothetical protein